MTDGNTSADILLHKIWRKGRFASFGYWAQGNKITIDIGEFGPDNKLTSATKCYVDVKTFFTYIEAEHNSRVLNLYPKFDKEGFSVFGGSGQVARIFKSAYWQNKDGSPDTYSRVFKCGHFKGTPGPTGAVIADTTQVLSLSSIKISKEDIAQIYHSVHGLIMLRPNVILGGEIQPDV